MPEKTALALEENLLPMDKWVKLCAYHRNFITTKGTRKLSVWVNIKLEDIQFVSASWKFNNIVIKTAVFQSHPQSHRSLVLSIGNLPQSKAKL